MVKGTLEVLLVDGKDIENKDWKIQLLEIICLCGLIPCNMSKIRPYVILKCGNQELISDVADPEGKKLIWNEKLVLKLEYLEGKDEAPNKLVLKLMDKHRVSGDDSVGEVTIYIKDVLSLGEQNGKAAISKQSYRVVLPDKTYSGEVSVAVSFTLDG